jgi:hypothetical protein
VRPYRLRIITTLSGLGALASLNGCANMPPIVRVDFHSSTGSSQQPQNVASNTKQSRAQRRAEVRAAQLAANGHKPRERPQRNPRPAPTAPQRAPQTTAGVAPGTDASQRAAQSSANPAEDEATRLETAVPPSSPALTAFVAALAKNKKAASDAKVPLNVFTVQLGEPINLPICKKAESLTEALANKAPITCHSPKVVWSNAQLQERLHPPLTAPDSEFPGLPITHADVRLSDAEGGNSLDLTLIGGYVVAARWDFIYTKNEHSIEARLTTKYGVKPGRDTFTECTNGYGAREKYDNRTWSFKTLLVSYEPVGRVCQVGGVVGAGYADFSLATYLLMQIADQERLEAKKPKI